MNNLTPKATAFYNEPNERRLTMKGKIYKYRDDPPRFFIRLFWKGEIKIYRDNKGYLLDSQERTDRLLQAIRQEIDDKTFDATKYTRDRRDYRFEKNFMDWSEKKSHGYSKTLQSYYRNNLKQYFGKLDVREIRTKHILVFYENEIKELADTTRKTIMQALHAFLKDIYRRHEVKAHFPYFPPLKAAETETRFLGEETQLKIMDQLPLTNRPIVYFMMLHGARPGEARALKWDCVDLKKETITIKRTFQLNKLSETTKTKQIRILPLHPEMTKILKATPRSLTGFVFLNVRGKPHSEGSLSANWRRATQKIGVKCTLYEGTRHSMASQAAIRGESLYLIGRVLGHTTPALTQRYAKVTTDSMRRVIERIPDINRTQPKGVVHNQLKNNKK